MILDRIVKTKQQELVELNTRYSLPKLEKIVADMPPCRGFKTALKDLKSRSMGLIAEVKKASPSKGLIRADFDPVAIAKAYESAGANCLSVLTDKPYFQGSNDYLQQVRTAVDIPILRKDFTIDPLQIYEARVIGADAILLIAAILTKEQMQEYRQLALDLGMDALVEVHDEEELERAVAIDADMIGINNRDLRTFVTDLQVSERLMRDLPQDVLKVSESGISHYDEIEQLRTYGTNAVLVGEHFMRQPDVEQAVYALMEGEQREDQR